MKHLPMPRVNDKMRELILEDQKYWDDYAAKNPSIKKPRDISRGCIIDRFCYGTDSMFTISGIKTRRKIHK